MKHRSFRARLSASALLALMCLCHASVSFAATPALLVGPDLKPKLVNLQAIGGGRMTYFDDQRNMQVQSTNDVLQIRFPTLASDEAGNATATATKPKAFVELISNQRIVAAFAGTKNEGQSLLFKHVLLGDLTIALDQVSRLSFDSGAMSNSATPTTDQVIMSNGDVVTGFVVAVKDGGIEVQQGDTKPFTLPRDRVKAIHLANPVNREAGKASMVWLRDGSRLLATEVSISADKLTMTSPLTGKEAVTIELKQIARIELASPAGQLIDLADLPMSVSAGGEVFGLPMLPRVEGDGIYLHAPVTVNFSLPAKAKRFAAMAQLDAKGENAQLAHFIVNILSGNSSVARHVISGAQPQAAINAAIAGSALTITLDPSDNGPVLDRLKLTDAVIFVERE